MSEWQPIETAPRDGTIMLLWDKRHKRVVAGLWDQWYWASSPGRYTVQPTDWMPLPAPPALAKAAE